MRADAQRNRDAVLAAAGRLFDAATSSDEVSMDAVAVAAGVGKGTLFRRFGDRTGLIRELYQHRSEEMENTWTPVPEGSPAERALDLLLVILRFKTENRALSRALEGTGRTSPYDNRSYDRWHSTLASIVAEVRDAPEAAFLAHAMLAAVRSDLLEHLRLWPEDRIRGGVEALVRSILEDQ
ncbi:MAG: hypothetical protein QG622_128 [Actinomycetota bacterium]|nr:hypothetical protein [Actinomycetota bacterium]